MFWSLDFLADYHDPCYGKGVCVPTSRCPSRFRGNGTKCVLGDYYHSSDGLCCNTILDNPGEFKYLNLVIIHELNIAI